MRRLTIISTGGTIEKTYDEHSGVLANRQTVIQQMLGLLRLEDTAIRTIALLSKDSLDFTEEDRDLIVAEVRRLTENAIPARQPAHAQDDPDRCDGVILLHGTDTLCNTGELLHDALRGSPRIPVVLTGAMRPFEMKESDALQNLSEAIFAAGLLQGGVWVAAHGNCFPFPGPLKDKDRGTFVMGM